MNPQLSQQDLAALIEREGLAFEVLEWNASGTEAIWRSPSDDLDVLYYLEAGYEIRLAPIKTPVLEQEASPLTEEEERLIQRSYDHLVSGVKQPEYRCRRCGERVNMVAMRCGCKSGPSPWEHVTTPLPAVKESLTPQPAPDVAQSATPRIISEYFGLPEGFFKALIQQHEASGYSAEEIALMGGIEGVLKSRKEEVARLNAELTAALAQRDEARRLLSAANSTLEKAKQSLDPMDKLRAVISTVQIHITNHLNK